MIYLKYTISVPYEREGIVEILIRVDKMNVKTHLMRCACEFWLSWLIRSVGAKQTLYFYI